MRRACCLAAALALASTPVPANAAAKAEPDAASVAAASAPGHHTIMSGTRLPLRTLKEISSKKARKGDLIALELARDYSVDGVVLIPAGTPAVAELSQAEEKGWMGRAGRVELRLLYLDLPGGPVRLSGRLGDDGRSNEDVATVVSAFTGFGFITGKSAVIPAGSELIALLDRDARFAVPVMPPQDASPAD